MRKMKVSKNAGIETTETNLLQQFVFRYLPYWPVFVVLIICSAGAAFLYLKYTVPVYETTATILVKDEKRGLDDSKVLESRKQIGAKNIFVNEI
jgi:tyrosine-protein kinase Etk/Wzc